MVGYNRYIVTGTIVNFDIMKLRRAVRRYYHKSDFDSAMKYYLTLSSGTLWGINSRGSWKVIKRKLSLKFQLE